MEMPNRRSVRRYQAVLLKILYRSIGRSKVLANTELVWAVDAFMDLGAVKL